MERLAQRLGLVASERVCCPALSRPRRLPRSYQHIHDEARKSPDVIGLRLYVENSNQPAQRTYQALGMKPGGYSVFENLWVERFAKRD